MDRFAAEVGRLLPDSDPTKVSTPVAIEFDEACNLQPEEAAQIFLATGAA